MEGAKGMLQIVISAVVGALGGNIIARAGDYLQLGLLANSVVGAAGGVAGTLVLSQAVGALPEGTTGMIGAAASGGLGGIVLQAAAATLKKRLGN